VGAAAGLTTAIVAGVIAGIFGASNVQVSGPTGAMTVVLVPLVARYGADALVVAGILAGVLVAAGLSVSDGSWPTSPVRWSQGSPSASP